MNQLVKAPMFSLCDIKSGKSNTRDAEDNGEYIFFDRSKVIKKSSRYLYDCEALIIAGEGTEFLPKHYKGKFDLHQRAYALHNFKPSINVKYLYYYLHHLKDYLPSVAVGATVKSLRRRHFENLPVVIFPIKTQQKIVSKLDSIFAEIDKAIATTEANAKNTKALFLSYLVEVFNRSGDGWIRETIGNICSLRSGTTVSPSLEKTNGELPYLKVADMNLIFNQGSISSSSRFINISDVNKNSIIRKGSTIFPKRGGAIDTNKKRITNVDIVADLNIMSVLPNDTLNSYLLYFYFLGLDMRKLGSGSSIRQINNYDIEPLTINFPKSHTEQQGLVSLISKLQIHSEKLISNYKKKKLEMVMLKQSILKRAFKGELIKAA